MRIAGEWQAGDDGVTRPVLPAQVRGADRSMLAEEFLVDSGADRTMFRAHLLQTLDFSIRAGSEGSILQGIGGVGESVVLRTVLVLSRDDGGEVHLHGEFAAFTDPTATDLSILGRDILNNFDLILSRKRNEMLLLAPNHQYRVEQV